MNSHALDVLEYHDALDRVARLAASGLGAAAVRALRPSADERWIAGELRTVAELMALLQRDERWGLPAIPDVREALKRLRVEGSVLDAAVMREIAVLVASSRSVRRSLVPQAGAMPRLAAEADGLADLPQLLAQIERVVDEQGDVRDDASPELARLRREIGGARARIVQRLSAYAASLPAHYQVPDASVTLREGRYVIPVRREGRGEVGGIVHDESGTGATLFVEPPVAIEMMNRLRELEAGEAREVQRILRELTAVVRPHQEPLVLSLEILVRIDGLQARARYAARTQATPPEVLPAGTEEYEVVQGRHPILLARGDAVVPFDLRMDRGERTLLISGPNTGGKTVLLKAIGLLSLLAQSGVVPPVGPGTRLPVFRAIFADIGDEQSIEASLSTFSAHLKNLRETLAGADFESLVLIDEIGSGTDPVEGGALARAILLELTRRSAFTVATTHLGQLKLLPTVDARVVNASLQFDAERLEPTYRLVKGLPGRSYGLAIARRLGMPAPVLADAEAVLPQGERDVAKLLLELEAEEKRVSDLDLRLTARLAETERLRERLEAREREMARREKDAERRARQQARDLLLRSRQEVEAAIAQVRGAADAEALEGVARAARRRVEEAAQRQRERTPKEPSERAPARRAGVDLEAGVRVRIESLGRTGTVLELRDGRAMVETGGLKLQLPRTDLTPLPAGDQGGKAEKPRPRAGSFVAVDTAASHEIDLRGLRVDELELRMGRAIDSAIMAGLPNLRIIHGKGTGALRAQAQELLRADPRILSFRPGERFEGGTGVTVAEFA
ncbi:MAG TPA: endonuclease MutS2 [Longimicrobiaceae bacterium]|nr:endonuclease MutS2 [Longimicrobiaceae bacterium]